jgi:hypothetical protein
MGESNSLNTKPPEAIYRLMDSKTEALDTIDAVIRAAQHEIRIFDVSPHTLRSRDFGNPARIEMLKQLLLANHGNQIRIALHDTAGIEAELARLVALKKLFSSQIAIHRTIDAAREAKDVMIIADNAHFWRKPYFEHPRSVLTMHDLTATQPLLDRYEQIWENTEVAVTGSTVGL